MICSSGGSDREVCAPLRVEPRDETRGADLAAGYKALEDPHRVAILHVLAAAGQPVCVVDIERHIDLAQSTISHHHETLVDAGVTHRKRLGKWSYSRSSLERLDELGVGIGSLTTRATTSA